MSADPAGLVRIRVEPDGVDVITSRFYVAAAIAMGVEGERLDGDPEDGEGIVRHALGYLAQYVEATKARAVLRAPRPNLICIVERDWDDEVGAVLVCLPPCRSGHARPCRHPLGFLPLTMGAHTHRPGSQFTAGRVAIASDSVR